MEPTSEQIESYRARRLPGRRGVARRPTRSSACASTSPPASSTSGRPASAPDEVNYTAGRDAARHDAAAVQRVEGRPHDRRDDAGGAQRASSARGWPGAGHAAVHGQHGLEAAGGKALLAHQDAAYQDCFEPPNMTTCWMALDDTHADTGTIYYARGSHRWGRARRPAAQFHAPDDWTGYMAAGRAARAGRQSTGCRSRCRPAARRSTTAGVARLAAERARRPRAARDHQPHDHHRDALAPDERPRALQPLPAARRARDGRGVLPGHVARGRLPHAVHRPDSEPAAA